MMGKNDFPEEWIETTIGNIALNANNLRKPISLNKRAEIQGPYPYYGATGQIDSLNDYTHQGEYILIGEDGANLLSKSKPLSFVVDGKYWVNNHAHSLRSLAGMPSKFLCLYINSLNLDPWVTGSAQPKLTRGNLDSIPVPLPPLAEQKVIADKLDSLLAQVETTKARLDRVPDILKRFRQSVLAAAVSGRLTTDWRRENKSKITVDILKKEIKSYRLKAWINEQENKFISKGKWPKNEKWKQKYTEPSTPEDFHFQELPDGWSYQPLEGLVYISARIGWKGLKASEYTESGPLFLSVHSLNYGTTVKLSEAFHISMERYQESPEIILQNDDILLCKDGAGIGKLGIVKDLEGPATINSSLLLIRSGDFFIPEYLYYFFAGPRMQSIVHERMTGSAVPHLFQRDVKEFVLEVPPIEEQTEIVRRVEELFALADTIGQKAQAATERVNKLTQSILAKAFRGDLTKDWQAANPDLISGENSAEALLEKIKAEREAMKPKKKTQAKKVKV